MRPSTPCKSADVRASCCLMLRFRQVALLCQDKNHLQSPHIISSAIGEAASLMWCVLRGQLPRSGGGPVRGPDGLAEAVPQVHGLQVHHQLIPEGRVGPLPRPHAAGAVPGCSECAQRGRESVRAPPPPAQLCVSPARSCMLQPARHRSMSQVWLSGPGLGYLLIVLKDA